MGVWFAPRFPLWGQTHTKPPKPQLDRGTDSAVLSLFSYPSLHRTYFRRPHLKSLHPPYLFRDRFAISYRRKLKLSSPRSSSCSNRPAASLPSWVTQVAPMEKKSSELNLRSKAILS